jgi:hypothetical protein
MVRPRKSGRGEALLCESPPFSREGNRRVSPSIPEIPLMKKVKNKKRTSARADIFHRF